MAEYQPPPPAQGLPDRLAKHVHSTTWTVGRLFGFQAFNESTVDYNQDTAKASQPQRAHVPASIPLAADHVCVLLGAQYARLAEARGTTDPEPVSHELEHLLFHQSVLQLHTVVFESFILNWCPLVKLRPYPHEVAVLQHTAPAASWAATHSLLSQISLYMLLWVEAANLRHMSEALWFFYWVLLHCPFFVKYCVSQLKPSEPLSACYNRWRMQCRTLAAELLSGARKSCGLRARDPEVGLVPPAATGLDKGEDAYHAAISTLRMEMKSYMEDHMPIGLVQQLAKDLLNDSQDDLPPGVPLHISAPQRTAAAQEEHTGTEPKDSAARQDLNSQPTAEAHVELRSRGIKGQGEHVTPPRSRDLAKGGFSGSEFATSEEGESEGSPPRVQKGAVGSIMAEQLVWWQLLDLAVHGDGGWIMDRLITPVFMLMAHEMDALAGEDPCHRLGYCDVNESFCVSRSVHACLAKLGVSKGVIKNGSCHNAFRAITINLGRPPPPPAKRDPTQVPRAAELAVRQLWNMVVYAFLVLQMQNSRQAAAATAAAEAAAAERTRHLELVEAAVEAFPSLAEAATAGLLAPAFDAHRAQGFWSTQVAAKTFVETRSWWAMVKVFWRVWALNLLSLQLVTILAFFGPNPFILSSLVPAHAILVALGRLANRLLVLQPSLSAMQVRALADLRIRGGPLPTSAQLNDPNILRLMRHNVALEGAPLLYLGGWFESVLIAICLTGTYIWRIHWPADLMLSRPVAYIRMDDLWYIICAGYAVTRGLHWILTAGDGYTRSLLHSLGLPAWLVGAYSCRPSPRHHLAGSMALGFARGFLQALAMTAVILLKLTFEYYVICKPMVKPVRTLLDICWPCLTDWPMIKLNWLLVALRYIPAVVLCQIDGVLAYNILLSVWTLLRGVLFKDLVNLHNWEGGELARDFHAAPARWWSKCMSGPARARQYRHAMRTGAPLAPLSAQHSLGMHGLPPIVSLQLSSPSSTHKPGSYGSPSRGASMGRHASGPQVSVQVHKTGGATPVQKLAWAQWRAFAAAWDCLLVDLRQADLLSNAETTYLALHDSTPCTGWLGACLEGQGVPAGQMSSLLGGPDQPTGLLGPVLLPGLVHQGVLQQLVDGGGGGSGSMQVEITLRKLRGVGVAVLAGCGFITTDEAKCLTSLGVGWRAVPRVAAHQEARQALLGAAQQLAGVLLSCCSASASGAPDSNSAAPQLSALAPRFLSALKNVLKGLEVECKAARSKWFSPAALDMHLKVVVDLQRRVGSMGNQQAADCLARLHSPTGNMPAATRGPSHDGGPQPGRVRSISAGGAPAAAAAVELAAVAAAVSDAGAEGAADVGALLLVRYFSVLVGSTRSEAAPRSVDAHRALTSFLNSLAMNSLTSAPSLLSCPSLATLTPVYHEDVVYALEAKRVAASILDLQPQAPAIKQSASSNVLGAAQQHMTPAQAPTVRARHARSGSAGGDVSLHAAQVAAPPGSEPPSHRASSAGGVQAGKPHTALPMNELKAELAAMSAGLQDLLTDSVSGGYGEDGSNVSLITYLITIFGQEFENFKERIVAKAGLPAAAAKRITAFDFATGGVLAEHGLELQLWASYRAQLLARTVRGMECYHKAIKVLAALEHPEADPNSPWLHLLVHSKYQHVVSAQVYGSQRKSKDLKDRWNARGIELLLRRHPALRVAYVDAGAQNNPSYSVLLRARGASQYDAEGSVIEEVYRIRLPANPYSGRGIIIGEGKPENQNHAVVFCITEAVQTIDANQDNTVSEALKVCNVLQELGLHGSREQAHMLNKLTQPKKQGKALPTCEKALVTLARAKDATPSTAIVGLREWIFSNRVGALGGFAAATEYAFSAVIQRVMAEGGVRLHYGHPDVFNRLHVMTRGGLSKGTRGLHVSEDVFAGLAHLNRGAAIKHCEHSSVGKGRDMGLDSILGFEHKISAGNAQVFLSRDLARVAPRLDLFRMLHFYYSGLGYFPTSVFTVLAILLQLVTSTALALANITVIRTDAGDIVPILYGTPLAILTGLVGNLPWIAQTLLDEGFIQTVLHTVQQILSGSLMFFAYRLQTTALIFAKALTYPGGATYIATGRGFAYQSRSFIHLYALYGRTHLMPGVGMVGVLVLLGVLLAPSDYSLTAYAALTWPMWIQAFALTLAAFWFTPESFSWSKVRGDWMAWRRWQLGGEQDSAAGGSWATWNRKQLESVRNWHGRQTSTWGAALLGVLVTALAPTLIAFLAALQLFSWGITGWFLAGSVGLWALAALLYMAQPFLKHNGKERRWWQWKVMSNSLLLLTVIGYTVTLAVIFGAYGPLPLLYTLVLHGALAMIVHNVTLHALPPLRSAWLVDGGFWVLDTVVGGFLLCIISVLCVGGVLSSLQAVLIFNAKFVDVARGGRVARALANRQGGLGSATATSAQAASAAAAARDAAAAKDAATVLENAVEAVEREDLSGTWGSKGIGAALGAARQTGLAAYAAVGNGVNGAGSAGKATGRKLASWLRGQKEDGEGMSVTATAPAAYLSNVVMPGNRPPRSKPAGGTGVQQGGVQALGFTWARDLPGQEPSALRNETVHMHQFNRQRPQAAQEMAAVPQQPERERRDQARAGSRMQEMLPAPAWRSSRP